MEARAVAEEACEAKRVGVTAARIFILGVGIAIRGLHYQYDRI